MSESERAAVRRFKTQLLDDLSSELDTAVRKGAVDRREAGDVEATARGLLSAVDRASEIKVVFNQLRQRWPALEVLDRFVAKKVFSLAALEFVADNEAEVLSDIRAINEKSRREAASAPLGHIFTPERLSVHVLHGVFESALLRPSLNSDMKLRLENGTCGCWVSLIEETIHFGAWFGLSASASPEVRLRYANRLNLDKRILKATVDDDGDLALEYSLITTGGVTKHNIASAGKTFLDSVQVGLVVARDILAQ